MSKKLIYALIAILAAGLWAYYYRSNTGISASYDFTVDSSKVAKVFIADMADNEVTLSKRGKIWYLNDSTEANQVLAGFLMHVLHSAKPTQPITNASRATVLKDLSTYGVKFEVYDANQKLMSSFTLGGNPTDLTRGAYGLNANASDPCIYDILSYDGYFADALRADITTWRSPKILSVAADSIASVQVLFANLPDSSYTLTNTNGTFTLTDANNKPYVNCNPKAIKGIINLYSNITCLGFENSNPLKQEILEKERRYGNITIVEKNGKQHMLTFFYVKADKRAKDIKTIEGVDYNPEFLYCWDGKDFTMSTLQYVNSYMCLPSIMTLSK